MYKSFVTCGDPEGIVECGMVRISKGCKGRVEPKIERRKTKKEPTAHLSRNVVVKEEMISKGAQVPNQVTDSWSKGNKHDENSRGVASDFPKGALDLQESEVMFGKLQGASQCVSRFAEQDHQTGCRNLWSSTDGSLKDSAEELKKVVKESLVRQKPLPDGNIDSASDVPSTSSSQCSMICTSNFSSTDSPISSTGSEKKGKAPTLIAKLMGVGEFPSEPLQSTSNQQGPVVDTDVVKAGKPSAVIQKKDPGRKTLQDILEIMHFQGLLKDSIKEVDFHSRGFRDPFSSHSLHENGVPIVLIKPQSFQWSQVERPSAPFFWEERALSKQRGLNSYRAGQTLTKRLSHDAVKANIETKRTTKSGKQEFKTKQGFPTKMKNQPYKKEAIENKSTKVQKLAMDSRKPVGKQTVNAKTSTKYQNQAKVIPTKPHNSQKQSTTSSPIKTSKTLQSTSDRKRSPKKKQANKPGAVTVTKENLGRKGDEKRINFKSETTTANQKSVQRGKESSKNQIEEYCNIDHSSVCETKPSTAESLIDTKSNEEADDQLGPYERYGNGSSLRTLLLNNSAFLHHTKEQFDLDVNVPATELDSTDAEVRLSLDCANEIIQCRSFLHSLTTHPPPHKLFRFMKTHISLNQLLDEACSGVETLRSYSELAGKINCIDNIQRMMERDIMHKDMPATRMWDLGWRNGFSVDDLENIVYDIETRLLTSLVEEIFL